jgi:hypothetical protein
MCTLPTQGQQQMHFLLPQASINTQQCNRSHHVMLAGNLDIYQHAQ